MEAVFYGDTGKFNNAIIMVNGQQYRMRATHQPNVYKIEEITTLRRIRYDLPA